MPRRKLGERILGPYEHGRQWRVIEFADDGSRTSKCFESEAKATRYVELLKAALATVGVTTDTAINDYVAYLTLKGNKKTSLYRTEWSLRLFYPKALDMEFLTTATVQKRYTEITTVPTKRTGKPLKPDSHRNALAELKSFFTWCVGKKFLKVNIATDVEGVGRRSYGKEQLHLREAKLWYTKAIELASHGDLGALGALMTLCMGLRAGEVCALRVRDIDDYRENGDLLWVTDAKTKAGRRTVPVPTDLRQLLAGLTEGRPSEAYLFGTKHFRDWPRKNVQRVCKLAGVTKVNAHSMRGLFATLNISAGADVAAVARTMGHETSRTTERAYAARGSVQAGTNKRVWAALRGPGEAWGEPLPSNSSGTIEESEE